MRIKNDSILPLSCRNTHHHDSCFGNGKLIPLGINQHWIVVAQSVRKGEPLNPDAPETGKTTTNHYKNGGNTNVETKHPN